jgi:hypothetical protein
MYNNSTIILIVILLLIIYLFDNIKELEDKILSNKYIKNIFVTDYYEPRRKYFQQLYSIPQKTKKPIFLPGVPKPTIKPTIKPVIPGVPDPKHDIGIISEEKISIPTQDNFSGASNPGSTTISNTYSQIEDVIELPNFINNMDEPYYN